MEEWFSPERTGRALTRFRAFWRGESSAPLISAYTVPDYRQNPNAEAMLEGACRCILADAERGEEDTLPSFLPDFGTVSTAAMWGGKIIPADGDQCVHIHPAAQLVEDLARLQPGAFEASDFQRALHLYHDLCERLGTDNIFARYPDFQGPMNTLALLMDQTDLLCALYETPDAIHAMLDRITDVLIATVGRFCEAVGRKKVVGMIWPYICLPADMGVCLTQDYMPLLSPDLYAEFELPRLKRIADTFGGVFIHCCGQYAWHLTNLRQAGLKIWGLESAYPQTPVWDIYDVFGDDVAYVVGVSPDGEAEFPTVVEYARQISRTACARGRFWFATCWDWCDVSELKATVTSQFGR
jgi:hypothetical protein